MWKRFLGSTVLALVLALPLAAAPPAHAPARVQQELRELFDGLAAEGRINGSVLVAHGDTVLLRRGYGLADVAAGDRNRPRTVFNIASLTKAFTATAVLMLRDAGLLSLDDTVAHFLPDVPEFPGADLITVRHLLSHTSGLFDFPGNPALWPNFGLYHTPEEMLEYFIYEDLLFAPGERFEYSNSNFIVAGLIVERVSNLAYEDFLRTFILEPLKLRDTVYDPFDELVFRHRAVGYDDLTADPPLLAMYLHPSITYAVGGMTSTVEDLRRWDRGLESEMLLSRTSLEEMYTPVLGGYALGWYSDTLEIDGMARRHVWHWGSYPGYHGYFSRLVDDGVTVILLTNVTQPNDDPDYWRPAIAEAAALILTDG